MQAVVINTLYDKFVHTFPPPGLCLALSIDPILDFTFFILGDGSRGDNGDFSAIKNIADIIY